MGSMKRAARHLLTLTFAALLALPQGWCCFVSANAPRAAKADSVGKAAPADCCCCPEHKSKPSRPAPSDDLTPPPPPVAFCCCEPTPASVQKAEGQQPADEGVAFPPLPAAPAPVLQAAAPAGFDPAPPPKRPLHLLRCVWLC